MNETECWLRLAMVFGAGNHRLWNFVSFFDSVHDACAALDRKFDTVKLKDEEIKKAADNGAEEVRRLIEKCSKAGIEISAYGTENYPEKLRNITNPPSVIYYKGDISCITDTRTITAVGARKASEYGLYATKRICRELALNGITIASGFAMGTDITAHCAAVECGKPTICVIGCGIDVDYPRENIKYREKILSAGGVFISEYPPGTPPYHHNFPKRNRILAAIGEVTAVFEASLKSGSLITASIAAEMGKEVFCLPPANIFSESYSGNTSLMSDGAQPICDSNDILNFLGIEGIHFDNLSILAKPYSEEETETADSQKNRRMKTVNRTENSEKKKTTEKDYDITEELTEIQKKIVLLIKECALHADIISQKLNIDSAELMTELTELEILGVVRALPGKVYELC